MPCPPARECWPWSWVALAGGSPDHSSGRPRTSAYPRRGRPTPSPGIPHASCHVLQLGSVGHGLGLLWLVGRRTTPRADLVPRPTLVAVGQLPRPAFRMLHAMSSSSGVLAMVLGCFGWWVAGPLLGQTSYLGLPSSR